MAIDATQRKVMAAGRTLTAKYKGEQHTVKVVAGAGGKLLYRLPDGREFNSPSSAGSAVMGGTACNGWRFWSVDDGSSRGAPKASTKPAKPAAQQPAAKKPAIKGKPAPKPAAAKAARTSAPRAKRAPAPARVPVAAAKASA